MRAGRGGAGRVRGEPARTSQTRAAASRPRAAAAAPPRAASARSARRRTDYFNNRQTKKSFRPARPGTAFAGPVRASTAINTAGATQAILHRQP